MAGAIFLALMLYGLNSASGQAFLFMLAAIPTVMLLLIVPPELRFWLRTLPVFAVALLAIGWSLFVSIPWSGAFGDLTPKPFAPDFAPAQILWQMAGLAALLAGALIGKSPRGIARAFDWLLGLVCLHLVFGMTARELASSGMLDFWTLARDGRFQGTIGNVNVTATVAGATAILTLARLPALARCLVSPVRLSVFYVAGRLFLYAFSLLVSMGALIATASRVPSAATAAGLFFLSVFLFWRNRRYRRVLRIAAIATAVFLAVFVFLYSDLLIDRMAAIPAAFSVRMLLWQQYLSIALQSPWYGYGLGSFTSVNEHFITDLNVAQQTWRVNSPHSLLLQWLIVGGVPYAAMVVAAAALMVWGIVRRVRHWTVEGAGLAVAILMMIACALVDIVLDVPATVMLFMYLCGLLWGHALGVRRRGSRLRGKPAHHERTIRR